MTQAGCGLLRLVIDMKISAMMDKEFFSLDAADTLGYAAKKFAEKKLSEAPVISQGRLAGMLTTSRIAEALVKTRLVGKPREADAVKAGGMSVGKHMFRGAIFLHEDAELVEAISMLSNYNIGSIPVVDKKGAVVGVLWADDLQKAMADMLSGKGSAKGATAQVSASETMESDSGGGKTAVDQILRYVEKKGSATSSELARLFSLPLSEVEEYAISLEKHGLLMLEYDILGKMKLRKKEHE